MSPALQTAKKRQKEPITKVVGLVFGVILATGHLLCWNIEFTSNQGQALWRGCSLCALIAVVLFSCADILDALTRDVAWKPRISQVQRHVGLASMMVYVVARLILIYLTIHSFSDLPAGVYDDIDWLQYIPFFH